MFAVIPEAFDVHGEAFALTYVAMALGRYGLLAMACSAQPLLRGNFQRVNV